MKLRKKLHETNYGMNVSRASTEHLKHFFSCNCLAWYNLHESVLRILVCFALCPGKISLCYKFLKYKCIYIITVINKDSRLPSDQIFKKPIKRIYIFFKLLSFFVVGMIKWSKRKSRIEAYSKKCSKLGKLNDSFVNKGLRKKTVYAQDSAEKLQKLILPK